MPGSFVAFENAIVLVREPSLTRQAPGKNGERVEQTRQRVGFQHRPRELKLVLLREHERAQKMAAVGRDVAFGKALQEDLGAPRLLIEQRRCGGEQQDMALARSRAHGFFGLR